MTSMTAATPPRSHLRHVARAVARSEWHRLWRSPVRLMAIAALLIAGGFALHTGRAHVDQWREALSVADRREREMQVEAIGFYQQQVVGPKDRPWVNLQEPLWAEWYTGSWFGMRPAPLASVAVGVSDVRGRYVRLSRFATPFDVSRSEELANPEQQLLGMFDLAFAFAFLVPLLLIALGYDVASAEREQGLLRLVAVQGGRVGPWVVARLGAVALQGLIPCWLLWAAACVLADASLTQALVGASLLLLYVLGWVGLVGALAVRASSSAASALGLIGVWVLVGVIVPAAGNLMVQAKMPIGFSTEITDATRTDLNEIAAQPVRALLPQLYASLPSLRQLPYAAKDAAPDSARDALIDRHIVDWLGFLRVEQVAQEVRAAESRRHRLSSVVQWVAPPFALQTALAGMAGTDVPAFTALSVDVSALVRAKLEALLTVAWSKRSVDETEFRRMAALVPADRSYAGAPPLGSVVALVTFAVIAGASVGRALRRGIR